ncbi:MAG: hypothetical protein AB4063_07880 [Crocosphaera sp.]
MPQENSELTDHFFLFEQSSGGCLSYWLGKFGDRSLGEQVN